MIKLTRDLIDIEALNKQTLNPDCGAILTFSGTVRNKHNGKTVTMLAYEAYEMMAQSELEKVVADCMKQWPELKGVQVVHRFGKMQVTDSSVYITVSAPHRIQGFPALRYIIDTIKKDIPIWKKEFYEDGESDWLHPEDGCSDSHLTLKEKN